MILIRLRGRVKLNNPNDITSDLSILRMVQQVCRDLIYEFLLLLYSLVWIFSLVFYIEIKNPCILCRGYKKMEVYICV